MKRVFSTVLTSLFFCITFTYPVSADDNWEISIDAVSLGISGVSPHVEKIGDKDRIWRSDGPQGTVASDCDAAGVCTNVSLTGNFGNDFTVITLSDGSKRGYFKSIDGEFQQVYSAPCNDSGCTSLGAKVATSSEMRISRQERAWGVPDPIVLPDGRVRIYIVEMPVKGQCLEKIATYISSDGITFTKEPGWRLEGGFVDTEIIRAKDGDWLMILADIACTSSKQQELFLSSSKDGLVWSKPKLLAGTGSGGFDPTGYETAKNEFRIYFAQESRMGAGDFAIKRATLKIGSGSTGKQSPAKTTITCVKKKKVKSFTGVNPKCPPGYKKK
jgi:hypothetical protein